MNSEVNKQIVVVADESTTRQRVVLALQSAGYQTAESWSVCEAARSVDPADVRLVIYFPDISRIPADEAVAEVRRFWPMSALIVMTNEDQNEYQARALNAGAQDTLSLPVSDERLIAGVRCALAEQTERRELLALRENIAMNFGYDNIIGGSREISGVRDMIRRVADTDIAVLITGPDGVGKDLVARVLHFHSKRRRQPIITVDFSTIPEAHQEAELFGTSDARGRQPGSLERAHGGTLLLKSPLAATRQVQQKLAEFLKDKTVTAEGEDFVHTLDLRVITVSSINLPKAASENKFLQELYYLLGEVLLTVPSLYARRDDVSDLTAYFMHRLGAELGKTEVSLTPEALEKLMSYHWPGNVNELRNVIKRALTLCDDGVIDADHVIFAHDGTVAVETGPRKLTIKGSRLDTTQRSVIVQALEDNDWNFTRTAAELGIGRTTLWRKVKKYNLKRDTESVS